MVKQVTAGERKEVFQKRLLKEFCKRISPNFKYLIRGHYPATFEKALDLAEQFEVDMKGKTQRDMVCTMESQGNNLISSGLVKRDNWEREQANVGSYSISAMNPNCMEPTHVQNDHNFEFSNNWNNFQYENNFNSQWQQPEVAQWYHQAQYNSWQNQGMFLPAWQNKLWNEQWSYSQFSPQQGVNQEGFSSQSGPSQINWDRYEGTTEPGSIEGFYNTCEGNGYTNNLDSSINDQTYTIEESNQSGPNQRVLQTTASVHPNMTPPNQKKRVNRRMYCKICQREGHVTPFCRMRR